LEIEIDIAAVARLARLDLEPAEAERLGAQLGDILAWFRQLDAVDTEGVEPTTHVVVSAPTLREDAPTAPLPREEALAGAAVHDGQAFIVPRVV